MPRYFFDLSDGFREADALGTDLPGDAHAEVEAIRFLGEVLKHEPERLADGTLRVLVHDEGHTPLWVIAVTSARSDAR